MPSIGISNTTTVRHDASSAASCLKKTMRLANAKQSIFTGDLIAYPKYWEFEDRVFCWLHPDYRSLIDNFYENDGPTLKVILPNDKIKALDDECKESLQARLPDERTIISDEQLLDEFYRVKKKLNCVPTLTELGEQGRYSQRLWHKRFGSYRDFLTGLGETIKHKRTNKPNKPVNTASLSTYIKILVTAYLEKSKEIGHPPSILEMEIWNPEEFDRAVNYFGGWKKFVARMQESE